MKGGLKGMWNKGSPPVEDWDDGSWGDDSWDGGGGKDNWGGGCGKAGGPSWDSWDDQGGNDYDLQDDDSYGKGGDLSGSSYGKGGKNSFGKGSDIGGNSYGKGGDMGGKSYGCKGGDMEDNSYGCNKGGKNKNCSKGGDIFGCGKGGGSFGCGKGGDSFGCGKGGDSFGCGKGSDNFGCGKGCDSFGFGKGGDSFGCGKGCDSFGCGKGGDSYGCGKGGDSFGCGKGGDKGANSFGRGKGGDIGGNAENEWDSWDSWGGKGDAGSDSWDSWNDNDNGAGKGGDASGADSWDSWGDDPGNGGKGFGHFEDDGMGKGGKFGPPMEQPDPAMAFGGPPDGGDHVEGLPLKGKAPPPPPPPLRGSAAKFSSIIKPPSRMPSQYIPPEAPGALPGPPRAVLPPPGTGPSPEVSQMVQALLPRAMLAASREGNDGTPEGVPESLALSLPPPMPGMDCVEKIPPPPPGPPPPGSVPRLIPGVTTLALAQPPDGAEGGGNSNLPSNLYVDQAGFVREVGQPGLQIVTLQPPPPPSGLPPGFADQIRMQISQVENTSGKVCRFRRGCKKLDCADDHPEGREISDDPESLVCRFKRKCKRGDCFYLHPAGREMDEDPSKGMCKLGKTCQKPECIFSHPEGRAAVIQVRCHACGEVGHIQKDCPQAKQERRCRNCGQSGHIMRDCPIGYMKDRAAALGTYVAVTNFPEDWSTQGDDKIKERVAAELEAFGTLSTAPEIIEDGKKVVAAFADAELAREAVQTLNGKEFEIELCAAPSTVLALIGRPEEGAGEVTISGFPQRWGSSDLGAFLRGALKKNMIQDIDITTPKDAEAGTAQGSALLKFPDVVEARKACAEMKGQKIAGKPLSLLIDGKEPEEDGGDRDRRSRSRSRGWRDNWGSWRDRDRRGYDDDWRGNRNEKYQVVCVHVDEIAMPKRPVVEPSSEDKEVYLDPLPDEEDLQSFLAAFGEADDIFRIPDANGKPLCRGYIRFKEHSAAAACVKANSGTWSESERVLSSQRGQHGGRDSAYPDSMVARILGPRGDLINSLKAEIGAAHLAIRGESLGDNEKMSSARAHFICKGPQEALEKLPGALEKFMTEVHEAVTAKLQNKEAPKRKRSNSRPRMVLDRARKDDSYYGRSNRRGRDSPPRSGDPWRPPGSDGGNEPWRPPGAPGPFGAPPGWPPPPHNGAWHPPPPDGPWAPPPMHHPPPGFPPWGPPPGAGPWHPPPWGHPPPPLGPDGRAVAPHPPGTWEGPPPGSWGGAPGAPPALADKPADNGDKDRPSQQDPPRDPAAPAVPSNAGGSAPQPAPGRDGFFAALGSQLSAAEAALADAVVNFLQTWAAGNEAGKHPNLVHLGADARIRECKAAALPPEVALRSWIEQRLAHQVLLVKSEGKTTIQLAPPGYVPPAPQPQAAAPDAGAGGSRDEPKPAKTRRSRSRRRRRRAAAEEAATPF